MSEKGNKDALAIGNLYRLDRFHGSQFCWDIIQTAL